jgi:hypothetical protein
MTDVPAATPVIVPAVATPVEVPIVAIDVETLLQVPPVTAVVSVAYVPAHMLGVPLNTGVGFTVTTLVV